MLRAQTSSAEASFPFCKEEVDALRYVVFSRALAAPHVTPESTMSRAHQSPCLLPPQGCLFLLHCLLRPLFPLG